MKANSQKQRCLALRYHSTALSDIKTSLDALKNSPFDLANLRQSIDAINTQFGLLRADVLEIKQENVTGKLKKSNENLKALEQKQEKKIKDLEKSQEFINLNKLKIC